MHLTYSQSTGEITATSDQGETRLGRGWAGNGRGKNNPKMENVKGVGPLPRGWYSIGEPFKHPTTGPFSMRLTPDPETDMHGRDGFLIHGPAMDANKLGNESHGCIVAARNVREKIHALGITRLQVVA